MGQTEKMEETRYPHSSQTSPKEQMLDQHGVHPITPTLLPIPSRKDSYRRRNSLPGASSPSSNGLGILTPDQMHRFAPTSNDISAALSELSRANDPSFSKLQAALTSPCFFHKRFGDAVNFEKVIEEIQEDDQISHSRLMQTAASVREVSRQLQRRSTKQSTLR